MSAILQGPVSLGRKDGGYGIGQPAARRLSYLPRNALHGAGFHSHAPCPAEQRAGHSCQHFHAQRTMLRSSAVQAPSRNASISDMDCSC